MTRVVLHIDRLVLNGFRREDRYAIAAGLEHELGCVLADRGTISRLRATGDVSRLRVSGVHLEPGSQPRHVGQNVAKGIGAEIGR